MKMFKSIAFTFVLGLTFLMTGCSVIMIGNPDEQPNKNKPVLKDNRVAPQTVIIFVVPYETINKAAPPAHLKAVPSQNKRVISKPGKKENKKRDDRRKTPEVKSETNSK